MAEKVYNPKIYPDEDLKNKSGIYQIRNLLDGKIYIGSATDFYSRKNYEHFYLLRKNKHVNCKLQRAFNKYGEDNFVFEIIEFIKDEDKLLECEQYWMDRFNVVEDGYNIQPIAGKVKISKKPVVLLEKRIKYDSAEQAGKELKIQPSSISCCCNNRKLKTAGKFHWVFYEDFIKMTESDIINKLSNNASKSIINIDTNIVYKNYNDTGLNKNYIIRVCNKLKNKEYTTTKYGKFLYFEDYQKMTSEEVKCIKNLLPKIKKSSGKVICLETNKIYNNAYRASVETNTAYSSILNCCYKKSFSANKLHWLFWEDYNKMSKKQLQKIVEHNSIGIKIIHLNTQTIYSTMKNASIYSGVDQSTISKICRGLVTHKEKFMFYADYLTKTEKEIEKILSLNPINNAKKPVRCIETGEIFNSVTEASKSVNAETTNISKSCKNNKYICKGYHWEYVNK